MLDPACGDGELIMSIANRLTREEISFSITGFDSNAQYLNAAKSRLERFTNCPAHWVEGDFLEYAGSSDQQLTLGFDSVNSNKPTVSADVIIANPPYVRTQVLGADQARKLAEKFELKGRVDLYYAFLVAMTNSLKNNGILGVITSNRYLSTKSGESIRKFLTEHYDILEVIDLGDTKLFDAAVLPAILIARKKTRQLSDSQPRFIKLYEELNGHQGLFESANSIYDVLNHKEAGYFQVNGKRYKKTEGSLTFGATKTSTWELLSDDETKWAKKIDKAASCRLGDLFKVKVGIKTTADAVFIREDWDTLQLNKPEANLLKPLISQETIGAWVSSDNHQLKVLYPHYDDKGTKRTINIDQYPEAKAYFLSHAERLKARKYLIKAGRQWFEIWVPHHPAVWSLPKLVFPDISANPRFYFDTKGYVVNGNCYWIAARTDSEIRTLLLIQGIANSKLMTKYHDLTFNNKLYAGRRRYLSQYVERYPLPNLTSPESDRIVEIVCLLNTTNDSEKITDLEYELEETVADAFGVSPIRHLEQANQFEIVGREEQKNAAVAEAEFFD